MTREEAQQERIQHLEKCLAFTREECRQAELRAYQFLCGRNYYRSVVENLAPIKVATAPASPDPVHDPKRDLYQALVYICHHNHLHLDLSPGARLTIPTTEFGHWTVPTRELAGLPKGEGVKRGYPETATI